VHVKTRLSVVYVALFLLVGVNLPYWPVWLASRGMDAGRIGLLLGATMWARVAAPWVGAQADRRGDAHRWLLGLTVALFGTLVGFTWATTFPVLLILAVLAGLAFAPIVPLTDGLTLQLSGDYGRIRLWGSIAFVVASVGGGALLQGRAPAVILTALQGIALLLAISTIGLPTTPATTREAIPWRDLLRRPGFGTFIATVACLQGAHAVLYGFATKHWLSVGIGASTVGWLWATGVFAEIALFAVGGRVLTRIGATGLLVVAGLGHVGRWLALANVTAALPLFALQLLHGATFGALHLGAMHWIRGGVEPRAVQRATALYVAIAGGISLGLWMFAAGVLYERIAGQAFYAMAGVAALGLAAALRLRHMRRRPQ
jgi:PPP family 3-phenylpropionic acid transporter